MKGAVGCVKNASGWARIFQFQELDYVFEIGKNCGTVFSVDLVKSVEMTNDGMFTIILER
jgi:hypothetical protein